ncbi:2-amino-4-hydroxy-6-hydroxymethyldihydropteridine diphosphokinase [Azospirillum melinis]|uniref:2-amino-4-hydroxy-6-hydroxymethyldihydropteridine pyrophosphokinase n=1 Tax=Azospirillum melinis TaxID=328839 RepID=A0ABX2KLI4_9PROT|nr:2-amino-4-hydroxy-6-hydroxymethyldihydropteridine diphosphokinase [Azospirillum melinis]MBP2307260.1 2-amino-4-hydroxy-6-hydroxymethyldihydropteridine diphosphokinase [Azospirillum melinis]NUB00654.1 2-amino-4-hydroxy-6-hydroxymethyldihydropteridine diphosphokinase [Azospirillum melinis]
MAELTPPSPSSSTSAATVYLALGGNMGDRAANLAEAIRRLGGAVRIDAQSALYETAPMYVTDQPAFLNMAVRGTTELDPVALLRVLKEIEASLGRDLGGLRFGPRPIDVDILLYADRVVVEPDLEIPHPRMAERAFVLCPLADIAAGIVHPLLNRRIGELCDEVPGRETVVRIAEAL